MVCKRKSFYQLEPRSLIWLIGVTFVVILSIHRIDVPYQKVLSSLVSYGNNTELETASFKDENSSSIPEIVGNVTLVDVPNSTVTSASPRTSNSNALSGVKESGPSHDVVREGSMDSVKSIRIRENKTDNPLKYDDDPAIGFSPEWLRKNEQRYSANKTTTENSDVRSSSPITVETLVNLSSNRASPLNPGANIRTPSTSTTSSASSGEKDSTVAPDHNEELGKLQGNIPLNTRNLFNHSDSEGKQSKAPDPAVIPIPAMTSMLLQSRSSYNPIVPMWSSPVDQDVLDAKLQTENAPVVTSDLNLYAPLYRNISNFQKSYELMEKMLKVYIYKEGERSVMHRPVLKGIYASEGWFMKLLEADKTFVTKNPKEANLFYLPFSSKMLQEKLYVTGSQSNDNLIQYLKGYVDLIAARHPFWNRTGGADHFLVACHDWAPAETKQHMDKCIRALCNANIKDGFILGKDVSLPETNVHSPKNLLKYIGGKPPSERSNLAFYAGRIHGYLRPVLLQYWGDKDPDIKIFGRMPGRKGKLDYIELMKSSKYCICPKGFEVNSPRVVEAIFYECVPVIISDNFVPPFFDVLNWESFAIFILEKDIPNLKNILISITEEKYLEMQIRVKKVQQHFLWHAKPIKYDIFHMILHSVWYNRMLQIIPM